MVLHFKEKQYGWGDTFYILDDNNQRKYQVKSSVMLWNKKFEIRDLDKETLVVIKNDPKSLMKKKFFISIRGEQVATITREMSLVPKYIIEGLDWQMRGVMALEYEMLKGDQEIFSIHTEGTSWGTRPVLKIAENRDELPALAVALTISFVMNAKEGESSTHHL